MKKTLVIIGIIIICLISLFLLFNNGKRITPLSQFEPFKNQNKNIDEKIQKVSDNMPKMEAATAFFPFASQIVENIYDETKYNGELKYTSTSEAYNDLINGKTDIIIATAPSDSQQKMIANSNVKIKMVPIAKEALVFYTRKDNKIDSISIDEIAKLYDGKIDNWKDIGGNDLDVKTFQLSEGNGSQTCFETIIKNNAIDNNKHIELNDMGDILDKVANKKGSIGYAFNSFYTKIYNSSKLKLIQINDIDPNGENFVEGNYPLMYEVFFIYRENNDNSKISYILNWLLSENGQDMVKNRGLQPIKDFDKAN